MNILILGGLFALGIVAILAVVLLGRNEQRPNTARVYKAEVKAPATVEPHPASVPEMPAGSPSQMLTVPLDGRNTSMGLDQQPASVRPIPVPQTGIQPLHELANEIRELHLHAWDLEQRLSTLAEMVDHFERVQNGHTSVKEGPSLPEVE